MMAPSPIPEHQLCMRRAGAPAPKTSSPGHLDAFFDVDIDLQLVAPRRPGTVRAPDLVVVTRAALERRQSRAVCSAPPRSSSPWRSSPRLPSALDTRSSATSTPTPASRTTGSSTSASPATASQLTAHHLAGEFGYADAGPVAGVFTATEPFPVRIDLDALV